MKLLKFYVSRLTRDFQNDTTWLYYFISFNVEILFTYFADVEPTKRQQKGEIMQRFWRVQNKGSEDNK